MTLPRWSTLGRDAREWAFLVALTLGVLVLLTFTAGRGRIPAEYLAGALVTMALFALFALGLQLQFGFAGLINFGHVGSAALGAYALGLAHLNGLPWEVGVVAGLAAAVVFSLLLGVPTLRLREDYLAIVTLGFAEILRTVLNAEAWLTNGALGIYGFPRPGREWANAPGPWADLSAALDVAPYTLFILVLTLALTALVYATYALLLRAPWGRVLRALREDEGVAQAAGKDTFRFKLEALALGAVPAALFGMAFAWAYAQIVPDNFPPRVTFQVIIIIVLGGIANLRGALFGSVALWGLLFLGATADLRPVPLVGGFLEILTTAGPGQQLLIGIMLIALVMFRPEGLVGRREELVHAR